MLGKLLKYEFKATARIFLLLYAALLVVAAFNALILPVNGNGFAGLLEKIPALYSIIRSLSILAYILVIAAVFIITTVIIVVRFYRMLGNEGYLWFTLPVTANQHIISKLIVAFVWSLASMVAVALSIGLMTLPTGWVSELWRVSEFLNEAMSYGLNLGLWLVCFSVLCFVSWLYGTLTYYVSMAIGPNFIKSRLGGSVLVYVIIYFIMQVLSTVFTLVFMGPLNAQVEIIVSNSLAAVPNFVQLSSAIDQFMLVSTIGLSVGLLALSAAFYFTTRYFITHRLNLT